MPPLHTTVSKGSFIKNTMDFYKLHSEIGFRVGLLQGQPLSHKVEKPCDRYILGILKGVGFPYKHPMH